MISQNKRHSGRVVVKRNWPYRDAWDIQNLLFEKRRQKQIPDVLLLTEHPPVYTFGKSGKQNHLLLSEREIEEKGIELFWADRGGDVTFHGPGQLVGYPIFDLHDYYLDVGRFLRDIEECLIRALADFQVSAGRIPGLTGVWVGDAKIAAIGVKISRWVTKHGFALNVNTDLDFFKGIVPCGITDKAVTSLHQVAQDRPPMQRVIERVIHRFEEVFNQTLQPIDLEELLSMHADEWA